MLRVRRRARDASCLPPVRGGPCQASQTARGRASSVGVVERFALEAFTPQDERLEAVTIAPLTAPGRVQAAIFYLAAGGCIARHPAATPQILAVIEGVGPVR